MKTLEKEILNLQELASSSKSEEHISALKLKKKSLLSDLPDTKAQGALVHSKFQVATQMDAPSKLFFNLERTNGQGRLIHCLLSDTDQELTEPADICKRAIDFYAELFKCELTDKDAIASDYYNGLPKIDGESAGLDTPLSMDELQAALMSMENHQELMDYQLGFIRPCGL